MDLLQLSAAQMTEAGVTAAQVMRGKLIDSSESNPTPHEAALKKLIVAAVALNTGVAKNSTGPKKK